MKKNSPPENLSNYLANVSKRVGNGGGPGAGRGREEGEEVRNLVSAIWRRGGAPDVT